MIARNLPVILALKAYCWKLFFHLLCQNNWLKELTVTLSPLVVLVQLILYLYL